MDPFNKENGKKSKFVKNITKYSKRKKIIADLSVEQPTVDRNVHRKHKQSAHIDKGTLRECLVLATIKRQLFVIYNPSLNLIGFVDQHAMHERIRYEYYTHLLLGNHEKLSHFRKQFIEKGDKEGPNVYGQQEKTLIRVKYVGDTNAHSESFERFHFQFIKSDHAIYLISYRRILDKKLSEDTLQEISEQILKSLEDGNQMVPKTLDFILGEHACKSAVKFNDQISIPWCYGTLQNASLCDFVWHCVHGRPTVYFTELSESNGTDTEQYASLL